MTTVAPRTHLIAIQTRHHLHHRPAPPLPPPHLKPNTKLTPQQTTLLARRHPTAAIIQVVPAPLARTAQWLTSTHSHPSETISQSIYLGRTLMISISCSRC